MSYSEYLKYQDKVSGIRNKMPGYVPSPAEVERLISYTDKPRMYLQSNPPLTDCKFEYENKIKFVQGSRIGEPCISEENLCMYLLFLVKTVKPEDTEGEENKKYIEKRLKELMTITEPDEHPHNH